MDQRVLLLNKDYQPLKICSVRRSIKLLFLDKAELLHDYPNLSIRTVNREYQYPSVIRLRRFIKLPYRKIVLSRHNILRRDGNHCLYCGSTNNLTIDHIVPRSRGGRDTWENLATSCNRCNVTKGDRTPEEANMVLEYKPFRPVHITFIQSLLGVIEDDWKPYLYMQ